MKLITVFVQNQPGQTARITGILAEAGVNIWWVTIATSGTFGVMRFLVDHRERALESLSQAGFMVSSLEVIAVEVSNQPGGLQRVAALLAEHQINLDNCSGFVANGRAVLVVETRQLDAAREALLAADLKLLSQDEMTAAA